MPLRLRRPLQRRATQIEHGEPTFLTRMFDTGPELKPVVGPELRPELVPVQSAEKLAIFPDEAAQERCSDAL